MANNRYYKAYIERLIAADGQEITLTREIPTDNDYAGTTKTPETIAAQQMRVYNIKGHADIYQESGVIKRGSGATTQNKLLAKADADVAPGDTFTLGPYKYRILFARNYLGICIQAELEVIE